MQGAQGQSLVGEPRSHMPPGMAPLQNKTEKKKIQKTTTTTKNKNILTRIKTKTNFPAMQET